MKDLNLFRKKDLVYLQEVANKNEALEDLDCDGFLIRSGESEARRIIASLKDKKFGGKIALVGGDDAFNRRALESLKIDYLVSPEGASREIGNKKLEIRIKDTLKQRDSGLNHVVAKIAAEKGVKIVIDLGEIRRLTSGIEASRKIARIMQNVLVCRKAGCSLRIASLALDKSGIVDVKGRQSFGVTIGMSSEEVRDCVEF